MSCNGRVFSPKRREFVKKFNKKELQELQRGTTPRYFHGNGAFC